MSSEAPGFADRPLDAVAVRVLGVLIEKEITTPDNYPLTLNALTAACNQSSNREPVMTLDESAVMQGLDELARRSLARAVHRSDARVRRYRHLATDTLHLHAAELAVLCVLLLRGAQTTGEIRTRTGRLFEFHDLAQVEITLQALMTLSAPLVAQLPRQPGQKEVRYAHLLAGEPVDDAPSEPDADAAAGVPAAPKAADRIASLEDEVAMLRSELAELRTRFEEFLRQFQ